MSGDEMKSALVIGTAVLLVAASIYVYATGVTTQPASVLTSQTVNSSTCTQEKSGGFYLRAVQDASGGIIGGVEVKASPVTLCNGVETVTAILLQAGTNSSGMVHFEGFYGNYFKVTVTYSGQTYNFTAPMKTNETTSLTVHLPSGSLEVSYH